MDRISPLPLPSSTQLAVAALLLYPLDSILFSSSLYHTTMHHTSCHISPRSSRRERERRGKQKERKHSSSLFLRSVIAGLGVNICTARLERLYSFSLSPPPLPGGGFPPREKESQITATSSSISISLIPTPTSFMHPFISNQNDITANHSSLPKLPFLSSLLNQINQSSPFLFPFLLVV